MLRTILFLLVIICLGLLIGYLAATTPAEVHLNKFNIEDTAWLAGLWQGEGFGGTVEEYWSRPAGGAMIGMFRLVRESRPVFYEFWSLSIIDDEPALRLKHFNPAIKGWEEKDSTITFELTEVGHHYLAFKGLEYRLAEPDLLAITLKIKQADGTIGEETFKLQKIADL